MTTRPAQTYPHTSPESCRVAIPEQHRWPLDVPLSTVMAHCCCSMATRLAIAPEASERPELDSNLRPTA
jgi:hypothetical protein